MQPDHFVEVFVVGPRQKFGECANPVFEKRSLGLGSDKVAIESDVPHVFGVGAGVVGPLEGLPVVRVEVHEYAGGVSVAIEDVLGGVAGDFPDPLERFEGKLVLADPNSTVAYQDMQLGDLHLHLVKHLGLCLICRVLYPFEFVPV